MKPVNRLIQNMTQNVKTSSVSEFARSLLNQAKTHRGVILVSSFCVIQFFGPFSQSA